MADYVKSFLGSPQLYVTAIMLFFSSCITTFDMRLIQEKRASGEDTFVPHLPNWVGAFIWLDWGLIIALFVMSWKHAIAIVVIRFALKVSPLLEIVGAFIMEPFLVKKQE